jgi:basic membrane lipoprotein Med (substrate-binding protein (PBP1-ABC) superfamily)
MGGTLERREEVKITMTVEMDVKDGEALIDWVSDTVMAFSHPRDRDEHISALIEKGVTTIYGEGGESDVLAIARLEKVG